MKLKKLIYMSVGGFFIAALLSCWFCYSYPRANLSFFLSGKGNPQLDINYSSFSKEDFSVTLWPELTEEPILYTITLKLASVDKISFNFRNADGNINIFDVFLSGKNIKNLQPQQVGDLQIISASANDLQFTSQGDATVDICTDCYHKTKKEMNYLLLTSVLLCYLFINGLLLAGFAFRDKLKQKLMSVYTLKNYALIYPYAKPYLGRAVLAIIATIPVGMMDAVIAWSLKPFMDVVLIEKQSGWTMYIPLMIVVFSVLQALFTYLATYMNTWVGNKITLDIKRKLYDKLLHNDAAFFDTTSSGDVLFRFNTDAEMACSGLLNNLKLFTLRFFSSISLIAVLIYNSWQLAIIAIVVLFGALMPLASLRKRLKKIVSKDANVLATLLFRYNEAYSGNRIISAYNLYAHCKAKFIETIENLFDLGLQMVRKTGVISPIMHTASSFGIAFVIWYGSYLIVHHQITVGNFASFITSLVMLYNPIKSIGNNYNAMIFSLMAVERVFEKLNEKPKIVNADKTVKPHKIKGDILYENVCFEYVENHPVLKNINLDIKAGQTVALVGNSGGGKTTVSSLLPRFYDIKSGAVKIDNTDIREFDLNNLRDNIAVVFQDNFLFGGTIRENILFGRTDISEEKLQQAIKSACLEEFIDSLDKGLNTEIGERGVMLSGGQKQRIAIARAFIENAPILILDEATSALDNKSEAVVQQAIDNLMKDRTVLVIAHRLSTVRNADCIVVINNGEIVEKGSHEELLRAEGEYAALYRTQLV